MRMYTLQLEQRYYQLASLRQLHQRLAAFIKDKSSKQGDELIGCIFDLIRIDNPDIARAVAIRRQRAMKTVIVKSSSSFMEFRRKETNSRPLSFVPMDMSFDMIAPGPVELPLQVGKTEGFKGYVIDLIDLRPQHQHLRMSVFWALFRDLAVFDCVKSAERASVMIGKPLFFASIMEAKAMPSPEILVSSSSFLPKTGAYDHALVESKAKMRLNRMLSVLSRREGDVK